MKVLVFDTETTGLPPEEFIAHDYHRFRGETQEQYDIRMLAEKDRRQREGTLPIETTPWDDRKVQSWPTIVQLSYVCYDDSTNEIKDADIYIELPEKFTNPDFLNKTHPIIKIAIESGLNASERVDISQALDMFMAEFNSADVVVAHNIVFDINMVLAECMRTGNMDAFNQIATAVNSKNKIYCTANESKEVLKIDDGVRETGTGAIVYNPPRLNQAYFLMFGYRPKESALHNAIIDVVVCLRVFWRLWMQGVRINNTNYDASICGTGEPDIYLDLTNKGLTDNVIVKVIDDISPPGTAQGVGEPVHQCPPITGAEVKRMMDAHAGGKRRRPRKSKRRHSRRAKKRSTKKRRRLHKRC